jgi:hypothetical protein
MADLVTLDDYKLVEGITSSTNDEKYEYLLASVSKLVRTYCNNEFDAYVASPGYTEEFDIQWDTHVVQLHKSPVIQVNNVYERSGQTEAYTELFSGGTNSKYEWYFDSISDAIFRTEDSGAYRNWSCGVGAVKVTYTAGYTTIPEDLSLAVIDLITYYDKNEHKQQQTIGSTTRGGDRGSSILNDPGFPDHIRRVLDMYRGV